MARRDREEEQLRTVALQNAQSILLARQRADDELLETKEALRASEARLRGIFNQASVGMAVAALDGRLVETNRKFCDVLGYPGDGLVGVTFESLTHPDDIAETADSVRALLDGRVADYSLEKRYLRKDGAVVWSLTSVTLLKDADGSPQQFIIGIEDITAKKAAEAALKDETRVLEVLNRTGKMLASSLDVRAILQTVTDAATELSGASFGAFFYNTTDEYGDAFQLYTLSGAPPEAFERLGKPRATALFGPTFRGEPPIRIADVFKDARYGRMAPHYGMPQGHLPVRSYLAVPVHSPSEQVLGGLFFGHPQPDVFTERSERLVVGVAAQAGIALDNARLYEAAQNAAEERKALLESERAARSAAERLSDVKDDFLATLSHELRTPLNAILGWAQVLRAVPGKEADVLKGLDTIERNARMQSKLIEDLLDMSRIASGKLRLDIQPVQPVAFVEAAIETLRPAATAKGIKLEVLLDPTAGPISGDPARLQQVIWNLLSNAIKFTPKNGRVQVLLERVNSHIEISIADTGAGIKPDAIPLLFDRFKQGDASTTRHHGGLGLGLSIVKSLVELHGGTITLSSAGLGHGTTAVVELPVTVVRGAARGGREHPATHTRQIPRTDARELAGLTIVVVDDHPDARELVQRVLEDSAATVLIAASAEDALVLIASAHPDVLISDIGMPDVDGYELLRRVRALGRSGGGTVPAIALTAFARSEDRTRALRAGFHVHISKPIDPSELVATVASVAGRLDRLPPSGD